MLSQTQSIHMMEAGESQVFVSSKFAQTASQTEHSERRTVELRAREKWESGEGGSQGSGSGCLPIEQLRGRWGR